MRIKKIWLTILLICCSILCFAACKEERLATSIVLNGYSAEKPLEFAIGKFSYKDYTVSITYDDGETEELPLTEEMIPQTDQLKFYQEGKNSIAISYKGAETSVEIYVSRNQFPDNVQLNAPKEPQPYTGEPVIVKVVGDLPGGTEIIYPEGNIFQNAGTYDMTAILKRDGYATKELSARVVINKATYNLDNAQLYPEKVIYDKEWHSLVLKGKPLGTDANGKKIYAAAEIPQGVSFSYSITKTIDGMKSTSSIETRGLFGSIKPKTASTYSTKRITKKRTKESISKSMMRKIIRYLRVHICVLNFRKDVLLR